MFDRYTDRSRRSVVLAQEEARKLRHGQVDADHVLLGLAAEGEGVAAQALARLGLDAVKVRAAVEENRPPVVPSPGGHLPFTRDAKRVLEGGLRESVQLGHPFIGTEHLLLSVAAECGEHPESPCAAVLRKCVTDGEEVREAVMTVLRGYGGTPAEPQPRSDELALVMARLDGIARDVGAIRRHLGLPGSPLA